MASLPPRVAWGLALAATLTMAVSYVDRQTLAVLAPTITRELDISDEQYGWLAAAFSIAYLVGAPLAGRLIDIVGARRGLFGAVLAWSLVAALHAVAPGFAILFLLRIALGLAESPSFPGAAQTVHRALPPEQRARAFGILFTGSSLGAMIAPPLATAIEARFGWRMAFIGTAIVGLAWVPVWLALAYSKRGRAALDRTPSEPGKPRAKSEWIALLRHHAVLRAIVVVLSCAPALSFVFLWGAKYLVRDHGLTQTEVGALLWIPPLMFDAGSLAFGHLASSRASRRGNDGAPPRALFAMSAALCMMIAAVPLAEGPVGAMLVMGVALAGGGGLFALLTTDMLGRVPGALVSSAGGITAAAQSLAYIVASPLIGAGVVRYGTYSPVLWMLALAVIPGCIAWLVWRPPPLAIEAPSPC